MAKIRNPKLLAKSRNMPTESVITRLVQQSNFRIRKDISDWRKAINFFENKEQPRRWLYYNLTDDLVLDSHLYSQIQTRKLKVIGRDFKIVDANSKKEDEVATKLLSKKWFIDFMDMALDAIFYGHSLIQISEFNELGEIAKVELVPRRHVRPEYGDFTIHQQDTYGVPYRNTPLMDWLIEVGDHYDMGLLVKAAPNVLWKKNAMMCWSEYTEIFGMPMRVGKTNTRSTEDLNRIETQLRQMGSAAYALLLEGETVEFIESTKGDAFNVYDKLTERCNSEISKLIGGQTLTADTGKSGTRAQGEVHERVADAINKADVWMMDHIINGQLIPLLIKHGYPLQGKMFEWIEVETITELDWTIDSGLLEKFEIDPQYFVDKYSVPIKGERKNQNPASLFQNPTAKLEMSDPQKDMLSLHSALHRLYNEHQCSHE